MCISTGGELPDIIVPLDNDEQGTAAVADHKEGPINAELDRVAAVH